MNRLRSFRHLEAMSQQELADILGISPQMVSAVESGRRSFAGDLTVLGYSNDRLALPKMSEPLHRHRASTKVTTKKRAHELIRLAGEVFATLRGSTPRSPVVAVERLPAPTETAEVEDYAVEIRYALGTEEGGSIPNLTTAVEQAGVCVVPISGLDGIDGLSSWVGPDDDPVPVIGIDPATPGDRFRQTLGHELGHLLFHAKKSAQAEAEAHRFAGALMFPRTEFDLAMPDRPQLRDFINLKRAWGVSVSALVYRAHELDYIDDKRYRALQIQMSKWRRNEPAAMEPAHGTLFARLVEVNGGPQGVAGLGFNQQHVRALLNWSHLRIA